MITSFTGSARFLSNFWPVPILVEGRTFPSVEHAYQAMKSDNPLYRDMLAGDIMPPQPLHSDPQDRPRAHHRAGLGQG